MRVPKTFKKMAGKVGYNFDALFGKQEMYDENMNFQL